MGKIGINSSAMNYSHARLKMGVDVFKSIFDKFVSTFKDKPIPDFHGWVTVMFDGTSMITPDTQSNLEQFGKHTSGRGQSGFPQIRMVALMMLFSRRIIDVKYAPCKQHCPVRKLRAGSNCPPGGIINSIA
jgi:hypothetical protein